MGRTPTGAGRITPPLSTGVPTPVPTVIAALTTNMETTRSQRSIRSTAALSTASEATARPVVRMSASRPDAALSSVQALQITASPTAAGSPIPRRSTGD